MLTFDAASHTYRWCGVLVPNVTRILAPLVDLSMVQPDQLEKARQEGVAIHKMVEFECTGSLEAVPDWMRGHYQAWMSFKDDTGFECWSTEKKVYHPMGYAGTPDLIGLMPKLRVTRPANIDIKRSLYAGPAIGLQTAAYREAWNRTYGKDMRVDERFALQLRANGTYRLQPYEDADDWTAFLALLTTYRWRQKWALPIAA